MTAFTLAFLTFVCTFGCALLAMFVRSKLPPTHLSKESQDVVRLGMGLVATMTALLLGLVTAAAKGSFDSQDVAVRNSAAGLISLDRLLARYGPEASPARDLLKRTMTARVEAVWPSSGSGGGLEAMQGPAPAEEIENEILQLSPATDTQRWFKSESLKLCEEVLRTRSRLLGSASGSVPRTFLTVVIFWLTMTFASFGLYAPRNATVVSVLFIAAFSVAAAIFLILELDGPFEGLVRIQAGPMRHALASLGR